MEADLIQVAQGAVAALQAGPPPHWAEVWGLHFNTGIDAGQILLILGGLWMMYLSGKRRDTQSEAMTTALDQQGAALGKVG